MRPTTPRNESHLPIARQFTTRSSSNHGENALNPNDSISVRQIAKVSSISSFKSTATQGSVDGGSKSMELESQTSLGKQYPTKASASPSKSGNPRKSWLSKLHPCSQTIEDAVMGTSDGMTVPFALTASLAGIAPNARYVMLAGLAELTAGALSMALGGALQARCEREAYDCTVKETEKQLRITKDHDYLPNIVDSAFSEWNFSPTTLAHISNDLATAPLSARTNFIMRFHHGMPPPDTSRYFKSASTLGSCYFIAGLIGIFPYMVVHRTETKKALYAAIAVEAVALYVFGYCKTGINTGWRGRENVLRAVWGAVCMVVVGAVASGVAVGLIMAVDKTEHVGC